MTSTTINNEINKEFSVVYGNLYRSDSLDLNLISEKCEKCIIKIKENHEDADKDLLASKHENLLRIKNVLELNIAAKTDAKNHYYTHTVIGKIEAFFKSLFKEPLTSSSIVHANNVLANCIEALQTVGPNPAIDSSMTSFIEREPSPEEKKKPPKEAQLLRSRIDLAMMYASITQRVYIHRVGTSSNPSQILFAKPNGEVYVLSLHARNKLGQGAGRIAYKGYLYTPSTPPRPIAILTTLLGNLKQNALKEVITQNTKTMRREQICLQQLKDIEGIIHNDDFFVTQINGAQVSFAMTTLYELGDLNTFLKSEDGRDLSKKDKLSLMKSISNNIAALHKRKKLHRDLKDKNILVHRDDKDELKTVFTDFESCVDSNDRKRKEELSSTLQFWSPEYFNTCVIVDENGKTSAPEVAKVTSPAMDMWALGLIYYRIWYNKDFLEIFGYSESASNTSRKEFLRTAFDAIKNGGPEAFPEELDEVGAVIKRMLAIDPKQRMTAKELSEFWEKQ